MPAVHGERVNFLIQMAAGVRCGARAAWDQPLWDTARSVQAPQVGVQLGHVIKRASSGRGWNVPLPVINGGSGIPSAGGGKPHACAHGSTRGAVGGAARPCPPPASTGTAGVRRPRGRRWLPALSETPDVDGKRRFWCSGPGRRLDTREDITALHTEGFLAFLFSQSELLLCLFS